MIKCKPKGYTNELYTVRRRNRYKKILVFGGFSGLGYSDIAKKNGTLVYYGGGDVAVSEIREALERKIDTEVFTDFEPNPTQVAKKKAKNPNLDPTPLKTYMDAEWAKQYESNLIAEQGIPKGFKFEDGKLIKQDSLLDKIKNVLSSFRE